MPGVNKTELKKKKKKRNNISFVNLVVILLNSITMSLATQTI